MKPIPSMVALPQRQPVHIPVAQDATPTRPASIASVLEHATLHRTWRRQAGMSADCLRSTLARKCGESLEIRGRAPEERHRFFRGPEHVINSPYLAEECRVLSILLILH